MKPRAPQGTMTPAVCAHHWLIAEANGPPSVGVCKLCGDQREFRNAVPDAIDRAYQRRRGVKDVVVPRQTKELAARISERPPGWAQRD